MTTDQVRYRNMDRIRQEEAELEAEEEAFRKLNDPDYKPAEPEVVVEPPVPNAEEETWKKRHGDLRRYSQSQITEKEKEIVELKKALDSAAKQSPDLPKNKEEAEKWVQEYPDLARVLTTLIEEKAELVREDVRSVRHELEQERLTFAREQAINKLIKTHPDFFELRETDEFKEWVESQPSVRGPKIGQALYDALYNNETDGDAAIQAVNIFKSDTAKAKKPVVREDAQAAQSVRKTNTSTPPDKSGKRSFSESEVDKMKPWEYDKYEDEIEAARLEGRFVYDLSGAAR